LLKNTYDADGRLLLSVKETTNDGSGTWPAIGVRDPNWYEVYGPFERGVTEEYRYDALGRRVWVRAHRDPYCPTQRDRDSTTVCVSTIERTVYDGNQVIAEIRQPGSDDALASVLESDGLAAEQPIEHFGQVGYVHGGGIDRPLELWRNYAGSVTKLVTHYQWQGALELGTTLSGQLIQCGLAGAVSPCEDIDWPGAKIRFGLIWPHPTLGPPSWWGTMAGMKENATGMRDMRNRQYDPKTGRFTQEDPIGLAGGANLYGFAQGDAVNFSDPFGLCPPAWLCKYIGAQAGQDAAEYWATIAANSGGLRAAGANVAGGFASLWTPHTYHQTIAAFNSIGRISEAVEGIYEFVTTNGDLYVGQSGDVASRLNQHVDRGKLHPSSSVGVQPVAGGKTSREIAEQKRINEHGGVSNLANLRNPIGLRREHLLRDNP
jgi:RHS repeat-associated protein